MCRVVYGGRRFLRLVLDTMNSLPLGAKHRLAPSFYHDIAWWYNFYKPSSYITDQRALSQQGIISGVISFIIIYLLFINLSKKL